MITTNMMMPFISFSTVSPAVSSSLHGFATAKAADQMKCLKNLELDQADASHEKQ